MLLQEQIAQVIDDQQEKFVRLPLGVSRDILPQVPCIDHFATIVTGIRRCGKSTLLLQILRQNFDRALFLNFEDIRLSAFETADFTRLLNEIEKRKADVLFFDEIQTVSGWETFIHQLLRDCFKVFVSGSNASLLRTETATHLTGRQVSVELFPFSYSEFLQFKNLQASAKTFELYLKTGGMPEFVKTERQIVLTSLADDILIKDIAVRHSLKDTDSLRRLALYLNTNIGRQVSANRLTNLFGIKSASTLLEYFSYLQDCYLFYFIPQFSYSLKTQIRNPKKIYTVDTGLSNALAFKVGEDAGFLLENAVFLHLRRRYKEIYYFTETGECDFVVMEKAQPARLIQVCYLLDDKNLDRELNGVRGAMKFFNKPNGTIVTFNQTDRFETTDGTIDVVPACVFFAETVYAEITDNPAS
ncbi:MAG: ATP-binding protein [Tannerella sp.]|jgi:predicted AAA+ superfamily ATPase|nr:ATP-binding protein [Tannerella sp.]